MKNANKLVCLFLAALTVCLCACTGGGSNKGGESEGELARPDYLSKDTYDGYEFTVLMTDLNSDTVIVRDFAVEDNSASVLDQAIYRRNMQAEQELGITISGIVDYGTQNTGLDKIRTANLAMDGSYDMGIIATYDAARLALSGDLVSLSDYGSIDLSREWWDQNVNRDLNLKGNVYFTTGDISLVTTQAIYNMLFNKDMFDARNWEYPYEDVKSGKWTFDKMRQYIMQVSDDLDGNGVYDSNDLYGMVYIHSSVIAALGMSGEKMASVNSEGEIELTLGSERAADAVTTFIELTQDKQHVYNGQSGTGGVSAVDMFGQGHCLFRMIEHIGFPYFRDTELNYGILPLPKLEETQDRYYVPFGGWDAAFVCIPISSTNVERTSTIIEYMAYISRKIVTPAYYEKTLVGKYIRDDDSYDMITLEMENRTFDIGYIYNFGGIKDGIETLAKRYSTGFSSMFASYRNAANKAIEVANETLAGIGE